MARQERFEIPCRECGKPLIFIRTRAGKNMPCEAEPVLYWPDDAGPLMFYQRDGSYERGTLEGHPAVPRESGYVPRWGRCPGRRRDKAPPGERKRTPLEQRIHEQVLRERAEAQARRERAEARAAEPVQTITAGGGHHGVVTTEVRKAEPGAELHNWPKIRGLLNIHCGYALADDEVLLLELGGAWYFIADIGLRMLIPRELYRANGFPDDYIIDRDYTGREYPKFKQTARCGNAVPPPFAEALVRANLPEWCS